MQETIKPSDKKGEGICDGTMRSLARSGGEEVVQIHLLLYPTCDISVKESITVLPFAEDEKDEGGGGSRTEETGGKGELEANV